MNLELCVKAITDPRDTKNQRYSLESLLLIIFSSVVSGYDSPRSISKFAELKIKWLQKYVPIQSVPCAETIRALLVCIKASELIDGFKAFAQNISPECNEFDLIALDGKTVRGSRKNGFDAVHVISAWSCKRGITLFAQASEGKKNEITTLPKIIDKLDITDATLTIDAMGCQKDIAKKIIEKKGNYILQLKANHGKLFKEVQAYHHKLERDGYDNIPVGEFEEVDKGHGRLEIRKYKQFELTDWVANLSEWAGIKSVVRVERTRESKKGLTQETSWYLSSLNVSPEFIGTAIRSHWQVENKLHWRLDVLFGDDASRHVTAAKNVTIIKRFCMNLITLNDKSKEAMNRKIMSCAMNDKYREKILF